MSPEHRDYPPAPFAVPVKYFEWNQARQGVAAEISGGGLFMRTAAVLPEGSLLTLRLALPGLAAAFTVLGRVVRTVKGSLLNPSGMGIRFVDISPSARRSIHDYVARRGLEAA
jgi:uncharacterized protein (TIGR02266 family)